MIGHAEMNPGAGIGDWLLHYLVAPDHVLALLAVIALGLVLWPMVRRRRSASSSRSPRARGND